jgi:hypothetical protein
MKKYRKSKKFLAELKAVPIVSLACEKTGISRNSVYEWRKNDNDFKKGMDEALEKGTYSINDLAESKLINAIQKGERWAIMFWLNNNKKNYARPRPKDFWEKFADDKRIDKVVIEFVGMDGKEPHKKQPYAG